MLTEETRKSKRIIEKPTPNYAESESSNSTSPKAKTTLPPDKISSKSVSSKTEDDMVDTVKITDLNFEEQVLIQQKNIQRSVVHQATTLRTLTKKLRNLTLT